MSAQAQRIVAELRNTAELRAAQSLDPCLTLQIGSLKRYQCRRFARTYADLAKDPRHAPAVQFFITDLYGDEVFQDRDAQFARIVPTAARLFSADMVNTIAMLSRLHALSEALDDRTARALLPTGPDIHRRSYISAWQATGQSVRRSEQLQLVIALGQSLSRHTHSKLLRSSLRLMRPAAQAAGLADLQRFLEAGFTAFQAMRDATEFLNAIRERESRLMRALFDCRPEDINEHGLPPTTNLQPLIDLPE